MTSILDGKCLFCKGNSENNNGMEEQISRLDVNDTNTNQGCTM